MATRPDTVATVNVFLTPSELGEAFANRPDDEQVAILRSAVRSLGCQADLQAYHIGARLFSMSAEDETRDVLDFLRTILAACSDKAKAVAQASTVPGEVQS